MTESDILEALDEADFIISFVCRQNEVPRHHVMSAKRQHQFVFTRHCAVKLVRDIVKIGPLMISKVFDLDHSTINFILGKDDPDLKKRVAELKRLYFKMYKEK